MSSKLWERQHIHLGSALVLITAAYNYLCNNKNQSYQPLILAALSMSIAHQLQVVICWRLELYHQLLTKLFGSTKRAFLFHEILFFLLFGGRMVSFGLLARKDANSIEMNANIRVLLLAFCASCAITVLYCVLRYFGIDRAAGSDHFFQGVRKMPMVNEGIFKYMSNAMYKIGVLMWFVPGIYFESKCAIVAALVHYVLVWVHYYCTEIPDLRYMHPHASM